MSQRHSPRAYRIFKGEHCRLEVEARPGHLYSFAPPPEAWSPPEHPFVNATSTDPSTEHELRMILMQSKSFDDFLVQCVRDGFDVMAKDASTLVASGKATRIVRDGKTVGAMWDAPGQLASLWWQPAEAEGVGARAATAYDRDALDVVRAESGRRA